MYNSRGLMGNHSKQACIFVTVAHARFYWGGGIHFNYRVQFTYLKNSKISTNIIMHRYFLQQIVSAST
jgi:hypothetical protein